ncbi:hypothetical protein [Lewinella sp. LCG006]|uniref:hypothetical protein n=1 Tax=Lewinella sp. LCG006 TaxID=3231911 RepID=UPI0034604E1E
MRWLFYLCLFSLISSTIGAQTDKTIEVVVTDTLVIEGSEFTYMVRILDETYLSEIYLAEEINEGMKSIQKDALERLIADQGGEVSSAFSDNNLSISIAGDSFNEEVVFVKFYTENLLKEFVLALRQFYNVQGTLLEVRQDESIDYEYVLTKKLLEQGERKAKGISLLAGNRLGELIEISENVDGIRSVLPSNWNLNNAIGWTAYSPSSLNGAVVDELGISTSITLRKSIKMKFRMIN